MEPGKESGIRAAFSKATVILKRHALVLVTAASALVMTAFCFSQALNPTIEHVTRLSPLLGGLLLLSTFGGGLVLAGVSADRPAPSARAAGASRQP